MAVYTIWGSIKADIP